MTGALARDYVPEWAIRLVTWRQAFFLEYVEPLVVRYLGEVEQNDPNSASTILCDSCDERHRRLNLFPEYISNVHVYRDTSMSFATLVMLYVTLGAVFLIFLSCFYHNQKTSPLFISPRRHRLPKLVPPPLPVDGYFSWVKVCFYLSDEEIVRRVGFDCLIFLRFHRLALRCIVKMSIFSFLVLLPLNYTGGGHANAADLYAYVGSIFYTDFLRFTMANVKPSSPRLWVHCFAAYLLTGIVVRELLIEYETFKSIRHSYLLSREPHLRAVLVTNIPRHLRSAKKIASYFKNVYPNAVERVFMCQNLLHLESLVQERTAILSQIEKELLLLCRKEKKKLYEHTWYHRVTTWTIEDMMVMDGTQERLANWYTQLDDLNERIDEEQRRRWRVMKMLDKMEAGEGARDIDYVLASPFVSHDPRQRQTVGLPPVYRPPDKETVEEHELQAHTSGTSHLRSRSPATVEQDAIPIDERKDRRKRGNPLRKAKTAIKEYGNFSQRDISFLGKPIRVTNERQSEQYIEDHVNEVTDKAIVVMRTYTAATIAIQSMHSSKPGAMQVSTAPEPRDILWENVYPTKGAQRTRSFFAFILCTLIITLYVIPVTLISMLVSESALVSGSPRLNQLDKASPFFSAAIASVQPLCIVGLQQLLPPLFMFVGRAEGLLSFSEVQMGAFSRYFLFQVVNVFLVTSIAGTIFDTTALVIANPEYAFERLGNMLPQLSSFFITFVTIKTFLALGLELVRTVSLIQASTRAILFPNATLRSKRSLMFGMRAIDDPGWFPFHKVLAQDMLVVVISVVFAVVAPLVLLPCALFCLFSRIMWTHHHLYVYESVFETGGQFWPKIFRRFVFGLIIAQMTITGQFILKEAKHEAYATMALMVMTYIFLRSTRARYDPASSTLPLELATVMDITLQREGESTRGPTSVASMDADEDIGASGSSIGQHDPFQKAYLQPALRANPKARPEQPFPPAQLGSLAVDRTNGTNGSEDGSIQDGAATVRLKSMNQNERRLIDRWWLEQLQKAGDQRSLGVLIGEECGTLILSGLGSLDLEQPLDAQSHCIV